ncbi:class I SAM-dependent methyltransferase [Aquabacterium sp. A7-Y]|uniref:class I SAM-dependent methyltransferase n=1 Tax=Aquabacterium sp. A7-Y TaxID=1349605 RepID=UPI00223C9A57|nr:class I SAM-dependent methyltransferase [Aquabacterium sp. A7-Y]MCW7541660.1 class I SAM-dependent methyltransferase [Aquabacterium sp. A7-Y]
MNAPVSWYERRVLPYLLDFACGLSPFTRRRQAVVPFAQGRVLEIGVGTGLNLPHYKRDRVQVLVGIDPAEQMHPFARRRAVRAQLPLELRTLAAERLPFDAQSFDTVVCTYTLCSVTSPAAVLAEIRRVMRPQGKLLFAEHGLAPDPAVVKWQRAIEPTWAKLVGNCHLTRDVPKLLGEAGFRVSMQTGYITRPKALAFNLWGEATAA